MSRLGVSASGASLAAMLGVQLLGLVIAPAALGSLVLLAGAPLSVLVWPSGFVALLLAARIQAGRDFPRHPWRAAIGAMAAAAAFAAAALAGAGAMLDSTWDGQAYHLEAVLALARGWNPVWDPPLRHHLVDFVPKAAWIAEALVSLATGEPESGKVVHLLALAGAAALYYAAAVAAGLRSRWALASAALIAANPVAVNQSLSFYVDGLVASGVAALTAAALLWWTTHDDFWLAALATGGAVLATVKFNGLALAALLGASLVVITRLRAPARISKLVKAIAVGAALTACLGTNPYLTNALRYGHPLHPLFGGVEVPGIPMTFFRNAGFLEEPAPLRVLHSAAARSSNDSEARPRWKLPFAVGLDELAAFTDVDTRIGGWGPLFSGCVLLGLSVLVLARHTPGAGACACAQLLLLGSVLPVAQAFWARYAPQLWLVPCASLLVGARSPRPAARVAAAGLAFALTCNVLLAAAPCLAVRVLRSVAERRQLDGMARSASAGPLEVRFGLFVSARARLRAAGVSYRATDRLSCERPAELVNSPVAYCLADGRSPEPAAGPHDLARALLSP